MSAKSNSGTSSYRSEARIPRRVFVEVKPINNEDIFIDALTSDFSDSGMSLICDIPLPIGSKIKIFLNSETTAVAVVTNIEDWYPHGVSRMGVRFIQKDDKWLVH
jgi:hypothetical protein